MNDSLMKFYYKIMLGKCSTSGTMNDKLKRMYVSSSIENIVRQTTS
ncbi:MAG: hypothetical protein ACTTKJ_01340 [Prevotella koreensis]